MPDYHGYDLVEFEKKLHLSYSSSMKDLFPRTTWETSPDIHSPVLERIKRLLALPLSEMPRFLGQASDLNAHIAKVRLEEGR